MDILKIEAAACYEWQTPADMLRRVERMNEIVGVSYRSNDAKEFREGWIGARFADNQRAEAVRLMRERHSVPTPDFEIISSQREKHYESTEAYLPEVLQLPRSSLTITSLERMCQVATDAAQTKARKDYEGCEGLIVYISSPRISFQPELRWSSVQNALEPAALSFPEVWIFKESFALVWQNGIAVPGGIHTEF